MWRVKLRIAFGVVLAALFAACGTIIWQAREIAAGHQREAGDERAVKDLRARVHTLELDVAQEQAERTASAVGGATVRRSGDSDAAVLARCNIQIGDLQKRLSDAVSETAHLRQRAAAFDDEQRKAAASANERFETARTDWQNRLNDLTRQLDAAHADAQTARDKIADLTKSVDALKRESAQNTARTAETARLVATLQDLSRRRDSYLTSVLRRYREITNEFRAMSGMIDSTNREQSPAGLNGPALIRIQNAISMAEDDLHQWNEVNARAEQVERKLAGR